MCDKATDLYLSTIQFIPECYKTQEMCNKVAHTCFFLFYFFHDPFKTHKICDEAVDDCLVALKFIPDRFDASKMLEKFHYSLLVNDDILLFDENLVNSHFLPMNWVILV